MQRPRMNVEFFDPEVAAPPRRQFAAAAAALWGVIAPACAATLRRIVRCSPRRWLAGAAAACIGVELLFATLVYTNTHPAAADDSLDPSSQSLAFDPVTFAAADGVAVDGWLIPALDERGIMRQGERALLQRSPALILCHDAGADRAQWLKWVRPLHEAGYVLLLVQSRSAAGGAGLTFGLRESADLAGAYAMLCRRAYVDGDRIGLVGIGAGANAALAAARSTQAAAVVALRPLNDLDVAISARMPPRLLGSAAARWLWRWNFQWMYRVDERDMRLDNLLAVQGQRPVLVDNNAQLDNTEKLVAFFQRNLMHKQAIKDFAPAANPLAERD